MTRLPDTDDYRALLLGDTPMMDMRSPGEFEQGAFPASTSLPLMSNAEREQVGICYKKKGQAEAILLGHQLVSGEIREQRLQAWAEFARANPNGYVYCFRGGLRSQTVQQWLQEAGIDYPLIKGGYKAMRRFLLDELERSVAAADIVLISGKTGTGKTRVIHHLERSLDLEGLANHRGSTFGQLPEPQPSQINFENAISIGLLKMLDGGNRRIYLEDEGRLIGRVYLPEVLRDKMQEAPMVVVEQSLADRIEVVVEDYVLDLGERFRRLHGSEGAQLHADKLQQDLQKIRKRLGSERYIAVSAIMEQAFAEQAQSGSLVGHREWVATLLEKYYDPMYDYQFGQRTGTPLFTGDRDAVTHWISGET
jgi:tRNA 2-selenouridine synthase